MGVICEIVKYDSWKEYSVAYLCLNFILIFIDNNDRFVHLNQCYLKCSIQFWIIIFV